MSSQVKLDSGEMQEFLNHIIENNRHIQKKGLNPVATEIVGDSGLGKTSVALQIAESNDLHFVKINLAQIEELGDLVGFPVRQFQLCKEASDQPAAPAQPATQTEYKIVDKTLPNGKVVKVKQKVEVPVKTANDIVLTDDCLWVDETAVTQYTKQGYNFTGKKRMSYCPPEWIADKQGGGILILDDWNRADIRFIQAVMEICDRQEYISWKLPQDWHIILTANPDDGEYMVNAIDTAQKTRFVSIVMAWNHERWAEWAEEKKVDDRCINFVLMHPEIVTPEVNPRSITTFFNCISSIPKFEDSLPMIQMIGEGSVGGEVATLFTTFINNRMDKLITPKEIFLGTDENKVQQGLMDAVCNGGDMSAYRADIASILLTRLINYAVLYASNNPITPAHIDRLIFLVKDDKIFTDDLKYHLVKKVLNGNKQKFAKLMFDTDVQNYVTK